MAERKAALVAEALRVNSRYLEEVVLGWNLCPWAERALRDGEVRRRVLLDETLGAEAVLPFVRELEDDRQVAVGLAIFPRASLSAAAFDRFAERVRRAARKSAGGEERGSFLIAAFHPFPFPSASPSPSPSPSPRAPAPEAPATPPALVPFLRRAPDPTLQLVRASLIERAGAGGADVSTEVARANFAAVGARGAAALDALLHAIRRDRDDSYARLGP
jgi:hypothetical protein